MRRGGALLALFLLGGCFGLPPREDLPQVAPRSDWAKWPNGRDVGEVSAVDVDSHGHVFVLHRPGREWTEPFPNQPIAENVVGIFDSSGTLLADWGAGYTVMPHGLSVAPDDTVWITDDQREQLLHFSHDGQLIGTLGVRGVSGKDAKHFGRPTDVAPTRGALFVSDGYINDRILRTGGTVTWWGQRTDRDGGLAVPHSIDAQGRRLVVAVRESGTVRVYDEAGRPFASYQQNGFPYAAKWLPDGRILVLEGRDRIGRHTVVLRLLAKNGREVTAVDLARDDDNARGHDLAIAPDGTIYVADVAGHRLLVTHLAELTGQK